MGNTFSASKFDGATLPVRNDELERVSKSDVTAPNVSSNRSVCGAEEAKVFGHLCQLVLNAIHSEVMRYAGVIKKK